MPTNPGARGDVMRVEMLAEPCDRCHTIADLRPWQVTESITYRGRSILLPWLCVPCFHRHKALAWRRGYA